MEANIEPTELNISLQIYFHLKYQEVVSYLVDANTENADRRHFFVYNVRTSKSDLK